MWTPVGEKKREKGEKKSAEDAAWWSLIGSQKEGERRGWVNTDALAFRHVKAAKSLKSRGCVFMSVCVDLHMLVLMCTYLRECQLVSLRGLCM